MFYIYENQIKADGTVNSVPTVARQSVETGMSYFYERCSKMVAQEQFVRVAIMVTDENLRVIDSKLLERHVEETVEEVAE